MTTPTRRDPGGILRMTPARRRVQFTLLLEGFRWDRLVCGHLQYRPGDSKPARTRICRECEAAR